MSPEQFTGVEYSFYVDFWAAAVMQHEILSGSSPSGSYQKPEVMRGDGFIDDVAADMLERMLIPDPNQRLGYGDTGLADIVAHAYFAGVDWERLERKELPGPLLDSEGKNLRRLDGIDVADARTISTMHPATFTAALDGCELPDPAAPDAALDAAGPLTNDTTCVRRGTKEPINSGVGSMQEGFASGALSAAPMGTDETTAAPAQGLTQTRSKVD
jgi:hypothetical protein